VKNSCRRCGKEADAGATYCLQCHNAAGAVQPRTMLMAAGLFSALIFVLAGMLLWHGHAVMWDLSWDSLMGRPAATINGEAIGRQDFLMRVAAARRILERQYGAGTFAGKEGQARLMALQKELLGRMVEERLIAQEAKRLGILISNAQVEQELHRIVNDIYGARDNYQKRLGEDGMSEEGLKSRIRTILTARAVMHVKSASLAGGIQPELPFAAWLVRSKSMARILVYQLSNQTKRSNQTKEKENEKSNVSGDGGFINGWCGCGQGF